MPVLDGLAAARLIRELEHGGTIHGRLWIIALTADVSNENEERCRHAGMDSFLGKPVKLQGIVSKQSFSVSSTHHSIRDSRCHRGVITSIVESVAAFIFPNSRLVSFALILKQTYHSCTFCSSSLMLWIVHYIAFYRFTFSLVILHTLRYVWRVLGPLQKGYWRDLVVDGLLTYHRTHLD